MRNYAAASALIFFLAGSIASAEEARPKSEAKMRRFVSQLIARMTLEEKLGQLNLVNGDMAQTGNDSGSDFARAVASGRAGGILNVFTPAATLRLQRLAVEKTRLKIPLLFGLDVLHGHKTTFPIPLGESSSWDPDLIEATGKVTALEAAADGVNWAYSPMLDVSRDPRWGRISEAFGEDPWLNSLFGAARVRGLEAHLMSCTKHFAAYGAPAAGREYNTVDLSERELNEVYLPPYLAAIRAGSGSVMVGFHDLNGHSSSAHPGLMKILRRQWKYDGLVVSDFTSIQLLVQHGLAKDDAHAALLGFQAGVDMDMVSGIYLKHLPHWLKRGKISIHQINESVRRVLETKYKLGLFDDPYKNISTEKAAAVFAKPEHKELARESARRSIVLLKNKSGLLPLKSGGGTIAVIGPMAKNKRDQTGPWWGGADFQRPVTLWEGLSDYKTVTWKYALGANLTEDRALIKMLNEHRAELSLDPHPAQDLIKEAVKVARASDVVILALGEPQSFSGEAASRTKIRVPENQQELLKAVAETKKPIVLVLNNGRPLALELENVLADAILEAWFLGSESGNAIADIIFGKASPTGRLTVTFPVNEGQIPIHYAAKSTSAPADEKNKYSSKYLDAPVEPLFPFGFGLTYTTFSVSPPVLEKAKIKAGELIKFHVEVENTGPRAGEELVQVYSRQMVSSMTRPIKQLRAFKRVLVQPGQKIRAEFTMESKSLGYPGADGRLQLDPGEFKIMAGSHSGQLKEAMLTVERGR